MNSYPKSGYFTVVARLINKHDEILIETDSNTGYRFWKKLKYENLRVVKTWDGSSSFRPDLIIGFTKEFNKEWEFLIKNRHSTIVWIPNTEDL